MASSLQHCLNAVHLGGTLLDEELPRSDEIPSLADIFRRNVTLCNEISPEQGGEIFASIESVFIVAPAGTRFLEGLTNVTCIS
jgi:hypothetical protein